MLDIKDLHFSYGQTPLLNNINLLLEKGHIYGLLGKNGAGKSTLLKNITGLAFPSQGSCRYKGSNVFDRPVSVLEDLYFIAEDLYVPFVTPAQLVSNTAAFYPHFNEHDFYTYLKMLNVDKNGRTDRQSYGQQKKAMIAFGLASNTNLLIMDEPTNGLDIPSRTQFRKLIASVQTDNRSIIISTHQVRDLDSLIDTLLVLDQGDIIVNSTLDGLVEKLHFGVYADTNTLPVLYEEESIGGKKAIVRNTTGEFSRLDIELLFNAILAGNPSLLSILKTS